MGELAADVGISLNTVVDPGLSAEEKSELTKLAQVWLDSGKDTSRADRPALESALNSAYQAAGLKPPKNIYWVDSPSQALLTIAVHKAVRSKYKIKSAAITEPISERIDLRLHSNSPVSRKRIDPYRALSAHSTLLEYFKLTPLLYREIEPWDISRVLQHDLLSENCGCYICTTSRGYKGKESYIAERYASEYNWTNLDELLSSVASYIQSVFSNNVEIEVIRQLIELRKDLATRVTAAALPTAPAIPGSLGELAPYLIKALDEMLRANTQWELPVTYGTLESLEDSRTWVEITPFIAKSAQLYQASRTEVRDAATNSGLYPLTAFSSLHFSTFADFAVVSENPTSIKLDPQGFQHCADGPAVEYADGFKVYVWHGTRVPETLIMGSWSVAEILEERNTEVRRCAIEKMGWELFIEHSGMKQVG